MNLQTTFKFRDEQQRRDFDVAVAKSGHKQGEILIALIDQFVKDGKVITGVWKDSSKTKTKKEKS